MAAHPGINMTAKDMITRNKTDLEYILMTNMSIVSQYVFEEKLLVPFEYANLKSISRPFEAATELVDKMIFKGETTCTAFLKLLQEEKLTSVLPDLKNLPWYKHRTTSSTEPNTSYFDAVGYPVQATNNFNPKLHCGKGIPTSTQETGEMEY